MTVETGSVILLKVDKGYGFIRPKDGGDNVYVRASVLQEAGIETLIPGQRVSFERHVENEKTSAINVVLLD